MPSERNPELTQERLTAEAERVRHTAHLRKLAEASLVINSTLSLDKVLEIVTEKAREIIGAHQSVTSTTIDENWAQAIHAVSLSDKYAAWREYDEKPDGSGIYRLVCQMNRPFRMTQAELEGHPTWRGFGKSAGKHPPMRGWLAAPLVGQDGRNIGLIQLSDKYEGEFTEDDEAILIQLAQLASVAIENARLYAELEASQERIVRTERLRALGELAGGVAHDFNNTLAIILGRAELLLAQTRHPSVRRQLKVIQRTAMDAARTVKRIEEFTRMRPVRPVKLVNLNQLVGEVVEVTRPRWKGEAQARGVRYDVVLHTGPIPRVVGDPSELREALTNILFNALDAMPKGGRITFKTGVERGRVYCAVTDTGVGMTEEVRQRIFDPFFTTKDERGSGLGLSVVYGIIRRHGGEVEVQSQVGQGSTFTVRLPAAREVPRAPETARPPAVRKSARVLVIDDDPEVLAVLRDMLAGLGHTVVASPDGASGLRRFDAEAFDLVFTDLAMPGLTGWQVAGAVKARKRGTPVIMVTGWDDRILPGEARKKGVDFLVSKPVGLEDLQAVTARALTGRRPKKARA